jgi:hypothetical protein
MQSLACALGSVPFSEAAFDDSGNESSCPVVQLDLLVAAPSQDGFLSVVKCVRSVSPLFRPAQVKIVRTAVKRNGRIRAHHLEMARAKKQGKVFSMRVNKLIGSSSSVLHRCLRSAHLRGNFARVRGKLQELDKGHKSSQLCVKRFARIASAIVGQKKTPTWRRRGSAWSLSNQSMLQLATSYTIGTNSSKNIGHSFSVGHDAVRRTVFHVACCASEADAQFLFDRVRWLEEEKPDLDFATWLLSFDETDTKVLESTGIGNKHARKKTAHSCVTKIVFAWRERGRQLTILNVQVSPLELTANNAACLWHTLTRHAQMLPVAKFGLALLRRTTSSNGLACRIYPTDDHPANDLLVAAARASEADEGWTHETLKCLNHQTQLGVMDTIVSVFALSTTNKLYQIGNFFRMGSYFMRVTLALLPFLASGCNGRLLRVGSHAVSVADRGFQVALISYVEDTFRFRVFGPNIASRRNKAVQQWKTMFTVWVGGYGPGETILLREDVALVFSF